MCGIAGILAFNDSLALDEPIVARMTRHAAPPRPGRRGTWRRADERVALGHRRLSIIDLSPAGHQPMANEDGTVWITYNGEVYNHARAARGARGAAGTASARAPTPRRSSTSTRRRAPRASSTCDGMFAFAIWDARRRELFLARDRLGVKPLYYARPPRACSSAPRSRRSSSTRRAPRDLDEEAFDHYLTFGFTPAAATMFRGSRSSAPGEWMT